MIVHPNSGSHHGLTILDSHSGQIVHGLLIFATFPLAMSLCGVGHEAQESFAMISKARDHGGFQTHVRGAA